MSIFKAGERNKLGGEDICTSFVFGSMDILDRQTFFKSFLKNLNITLSKKELESAKFDFWTQINKKRDLRIPDVIIKSKTNLIYVENKIADYVNSKQFVKQLKDEYKDSKRNNGNSFLIYITNDANEPYDVREKLDIYFKKDAENIKWCNWNRIHKFVLENIKNNSLNPLAKRLLNELKDYLEIQILNKPTYYGVIASINSDNFDGERWLKDVLKRKETRYGSKRSNELAGVDQKLLLYSTNEQAILGEATICSFNNDKTNYWYDFKNPTTDRSTFVKYKTKIGLKDLEKLGINIHILKNITNEEYEQIRNISKIPTRKKI